jgi:Putative lipoprotein
LAIDGNNLDAKQGLDRALKLDQVLARTQRGKTEFELGSYKLAIELFQDALSIDPNWEPAINGLNQAKKSYADNLFLESLSKGYRSLNDESFDDAKILFEQALSVRPNSKEALQALDELNLKRIASLTKSLKYKGLIAEVNEEWNQAKGFYEEILVIDPNLEEVKESLNRVESRILLDAEMTSIIARSDAYNDNKVLGQAQALLGTAKSIERIGPKLEQSIQKMDSLIRIALIPIREIFESDQLTKVTILK